MKEGCQEALRTYLWFVVMKLKPAHSAQLCGLSPATVSCTGWVESQTESGVCLCQKRTIKEKVEGTHVRKRLWLTMESKPHMTENEARQGQRTADGENVFGSTDWKSWS